MTRITTNRMPPPHSQKSGQMGSWPRRSRCVGGLLAALGCSVPGLSRDTKTVERARVRAEARGSLRATRTPIEISVSSMIAGAPSTRGLTSLWRAGSALAAAPAIGPDGALYVVARQGTLDVLEASGEHRFTITLGGAPTGGIFVDDRGWAYVGLATGKLLGIAPSGLKSFALQLPGGISGNVAFAEGQGLLLLGHDNIVVGVNRGGVPTMRMSAAPRATAGPVGIFGWCVVATANGEVIWGDRWGKRHRATVGAAPKVLEATATGAIWVLANEELTAFSSPRTLAFRHSGTVAIVTGPPRLATTGVEGVRLTAAGEFEWLGKSGARVASRKLTADVRPASELAMGLDDEGTVWFMEEGRVHALGPQGDGDRTLELGRDLLAPVCDGPRRRTLVSTVEGEVFAISWAQRVAR